MVEPLPVGSFTSALPTSISPFLAPFEATSPACGVRVGGAQSMSLFNYLLSILVDSIKVIYERPGKDQHKSNAEFSAMQTNIKRY